ncbi:hypothetical protein B9Z55_028002 [Caenorhabditis nigoni]|uniref:Uncharacterized protein n=1 Tax=Caenorhabditis nigoni TaxID=1611254 RepID=A0A2G5SDK0_9PELO|nr:hypothetical protein B9Z55_028002 [Caenorhabditis nigoni]
MANQEEEEKLQALSEPKRRDTRGARCRKEAVGVRNQPENASGVARQGTADPEGVRGQRRGSRAGGRSRNSNEPRIPVARANPKDRIVAEAPKTERAAPEDVLRAPENAGICGGTMEGAG